MNKLVDKILNCLHWFDMFFPGQKEKIDWKEVGQMRSRLVKMRFGDNAERSNRFIPTAQTSGSMLVNFRSMHGDQNKQSLSRWYGKECVVTREKELSARIVAVQREHEARQTSGQYQAITPEEAGAVYEARQPQMSREAEAKLASFLSGTTDDINELLFTSLADERSDKLEESAPLNKAKDDGLASRFSRKSITEYISPQIIDALEQAHKLDSYTPAEHAAIELKAEHVPSAVSTEESAMKPEDDNSDNNCRSMADARSRKAAASKSKLHRKLRD